MTPTPLRVLFQIIEEGRERAKGGERVTVDDIGTRWMRNHKITPLLPTDPTLCDMLYARAKQMVRQRLGQEVDPNGNRVILSPIHPGNGRTPRGYIGREAMTVAEHVYLGNQQVATGTKKRAEGTSRLDLSGQALALGKSMSDPMGELATKVSSREPDE